jgi:hypothetical protein
VDQVDQATVLAPVAGPAERVVAPALLGSALASQAMRLVVLVRDPVRDLDLAQPVQQLVPALSP